MSSSYLEKLAEEHGIKSFQPSDLAGLDGDSDGADTNTSYGSISDFSDVNDQEFNKERKRGNRRSRASGATISSLPSVQQQILEKDNRIRELEELLTARTNQVTHKYRQLEHKYNLTQQQFRRDMMSYDQQVKIREEKHIAETAVLRNRIEQLEGGPDMERQLELVKDSLRDLTISEAMYLDYKSIEEKKQSIKEFVLVRVHELMSTAMATRDTLSVENQNLQEKYVKLEEEFNHLKREAEHRQKSAQLMEQHYKDELKMLELNNQSLNQDNTQKNLKCHELETKGKMYDELKRRNDQLEKMNGELDRRDMMHSVTVRGMEDEKKGLQTRLLDSEKTNDLLKMDNAHLTKEADILRERCQQQLLDRDRHLKQIDLLKKTKEELVEKLIKVRDDHKETYEERLNGELARLQERTQGDLEQIRINQREAYEREVKGLREARDISVAEADKLNNKLSTLEATHNDLMDEHRSLQARFDTSTSDLRNTIKLKQFELDRLGLTYEETMSDFRQLKLENEMQLKKNEVLKNEFYSLQGKSGTNIQELEHEIKRLQEKLTTYEQLEYELDVAIMHSGMEVESKNGRATLKGINHVLESLGASVPTSNKRRIKQSILLAQKLLQKEKEMEILRKELEQVTEQCVELNQKLTGAERVLEMVQQPQSYLIQTIRARDEELKSAALSIKSLEHQVHSHKNEIGNLNAANLKLENDLRIFLGQNTNLDKLRSILEGLRKANGGVLMGTNKNNNNKENKSPITSSSPTSSSPSGNSLNSPSQQTMALIGENLSLSSSTPPPSSRNRNNNNNNNNNNNPNGVAVNNQLNYGGLAKSGTNFSNNPQPVWFRKLRRNL